MKRPLPRGRPVDMPRIRRWIEDFAGYRHNVNEARIDRWLEQFSAPDRDLAARVLDAVDFITTEQVAASYRNALNALPGWNVNPGDRTGRWVFAPYSVSAGESGDTMLHRFRLANNLASGRYNELFLHKSDLLRAGLEHNDTIVFVDDFAGTGNQVVTNWTVLQELVPEQPAMYLTLVGAATSAITHIQDNTPLHVHANHVFTAGDNVFDEECRHFTSAEKDTLLKYCQRARPHEPRGRGDAGLLVVLSHNCPNNSLPILHASRGRWEGLFRRYD